MPDDSAAFDRSNVDRDSDTDVELLSRLKLLYTNANGFIFTCLSTSYHIVVTRQNG